MNRVIFVEKPVAALRLNVDIVAGNAASDRLVIAASHAFSCCVKRSTSESVAIANVLY